MTAAFIEESIMLRRSMEKFRAMLTTSQTSNFFLATDFIMNC